MIKVLIKITFLSVIYSFCAPSAQGMIVLFKKRCLDEVERCQKNPAERRPFGSISFDSFFHQNRLRYVTLNDFPVQLSSPLIFKARKKSKDKSMQTVCDESTQTVCDESTQTISDPSGEKKGSAWWVRPFFGGFVAGCLFTGSLILGSAMVYCFVVEPSFIKRNHIKLKVVVESLLHELKAKGYWSVFVEAVSLQKEIIGDCFRKIGGFLGFLDKAPILVEQLSEISPFCSF